MSENRKQLCKLAKVHLGWSPNFPCTGHRLTGPPSLLSREDITQNAVSRATDTLV